jgi:hypothetical protein
MRRGEEVSASQQSWLAERGQQDLYLAALLDVTAVACLS